MDIVGYGTSHVLQTENITIVLFDYHITSCNKHRIIFLINLWLYQ